MNRAVGVLMPVSSLPSPCGIGTLGKQAYKFVDFLKASGCGLWQVLPLLPTSYGDSPYSSFSAFALNHYFIDLDLLCEDGLLKREEYASLDWGDDKRRADYGKLYYLRVNVLKKAFARFDCSKPEWTKFIKKGKYRDYALFMSLKDKFGGAPCEQWGEFSEYNEQLVSKFEREHSQEVLFWQFTQFIFLRQWKELKTFAHRRGVKIIGDIPLYVARDSVEMWKYKKELFLLDGEGNPAVQAGVPPDAFSETGQLWGNPVYNWEKMRGEGYEWWHKRIKEGLELYDVLRIDHFIGFVRYYCIPAGEKDARVGEWRKGPGAELFEGFENRGIIAEDLGIVVDEVRQAIKKTGYPGMKILQHAFDGSEDNEHRPSNYIENCVAYTGTHDNEMLKAKLLSMNEWEYQTMLRVLKEECERAGIEAKCESVESVCGTILRLLFASRANIIIFPLQDVLCMGNEGRINVPSVVSPDNWSYRFIESDFTAELADLICGMAKESGRTASVNRKNK